MGRVRKRNSERIEEVIWNSHKKELRFLREEKQMTVNSIIDYMREKYNFEASKYQYDYQLHKIWGMRSNMTDSEWQRVIAAVLVLRQQGVSYEVRFRKRLISQDQIDREISRRRKLVKSVETSSSDPCATLPTDLTISVVPNAQSASNSSEAIFPGLQNTPFYRSSSDRDVYLESLPVLSHAFDPTCTAAMQLQCISLGVFEPHDWNVTIDRNIWKAITRISRNILQMLDITSAGFESIYHTFSHDSNQIITRDPDFLIPRYLLSSLLNGSEPSANFTNSQLHQVLRALPKFTILQLFEKLASPYAGILRERVFTSALDSGDAETVDTMLCLGLDPCEKIWFNSTYSSGADLPLERALYFRNFSVCKAIVSHRCKAQTNSGLSLGSTQDQVLHELLEGFYKLADRYNPLTSLEWKDFIELISISLSTGGRITNECFFVAYYDRDLAPLFLAQETTGVNGWIKRGLLATRWPQTTHRSSAAKKAEFQQIHWMLRYLLLQQRTHIATNDPMVMAEIRRALKEAMGAKDLRAILTIVEFCWRSTEDTGVDILKSFLVQNWESSPASVHEPVIGSQIDSRCFEDGNRIEDQAPLNKKTKKYYGDIAEAIIDDDGTQLPWVFDQYRSDMDLRHYIHNPKNRLDEQFFRRAVDKDQFDIVVRLFEKLVPRSDRALAYILHTGKAGAIDSIICHSDQCFAALKETLTDQPKYSYLEELMYRVRGDFQSRNSLFSLNISSNAHQQITLRCLCYYAIYNDHYKLLEWLVDNDLDTGEFVQVEREGRQTSFENMRKTVTHAGGLMPNRGGDFSGSHVYPSILSVAGMQNKSFVVRLLVDLGANGRDSVALVRAIENKASLDTIETLLEVADLGNNKRSFRHYGSAALRRLIRWKDYPLLQFLAGKVDINGIELLPEEILDPRSAEPLSPLGEAILAQDDSAIKFLLGKGCDPQALVCYDGFPNKYKRGAYLQRLSPLLAAIDLGNLEIVQTLIENNAPVDPGPTQGLFRSPLQRAAEIGNFEIVQYLLSQNARVDDPSFYSGGTPLQLAALGGHVGVAKLLIDQGADPNHVPARGDGRTAFEAAAEWGRADMMSLLVKRGANLDLKFEEHAESQYHRALFFAERNGHPASKRFVQDIYGDTIVARSHLSLTNFRASASETNLPVSGFVESEDIAHAYNGRGPTDGLVEGDAFGSSVLSMSNTSFNVEDEGFGVFTSFDNDIASRGFMASYGVHSFEGLDH